MNILLFTHSQDIDGMGSTVLSRIETIWEYIFNDCKFKTKENPFSGNI